MTRWKEFYNARVTDLEPGSHLSQVGHTVHGQPIPADQVAALLAQMIEELQIGPDDHFLDICCGNGLFTSSLAERACVALGVDLSDRMIAVASRDFSRPNLEYLELDATALRRLESRPEAPFSRAMLFAAWQHFNPETGRTILSDLLTLAGADLRIFLGFIPDKALRDNFLDTPERRAADAAHTAAGTNPFECWWERPVLEQIADDLGLTCHFTPVPPALHAASYRFNATLARK